MNTKRFWISGIAATVCCFLLVSWNDDNPSTNKIVGYLYTSTDGEGTNTVIQFARHKDGTLSDEKSYSTNSKGGANVADGGDARGDFDSQGAMQIIGNYLLTVNAGGNEVSVFKLNRKNGNLSFKSNTASGGARPVSIAYTKKKGSKNDYWLVVGNQWNNPNVQKDKPNLERYPNNEWYLKDLYAPDATDAQRNIQLFSFNAVTGVLTSEKQLDSYVRAVGGPVDVSFSKDGKKLAVATWGIAHFETENPLLEEQRPSRVYVYDFEAGKVSNERYFEETGISGSVGFNWSKKDSNTLFVSNFNLIKSRLDNSVTVLVDNGTTITKTSKAPSTSAVVKTEACWTELNSKGTKLYVASFDSNQISTYNISGSTITLSSVADRKGENPIGDSKDLWITPDNKYLYNTGGFQSYTVNLFDITKTGSTYRAQTKVTSTAGAGIGKYDFLGLIGFDI